MSLNFPYFGGKYLKRKEIIKRFPKHECYVEPFFGGGSVFFEKEPSNFEIINDIYSDLMNLFQVIKTYPESFICELQYTLYSRSLFYRYRTEMESETTKLTNIQRALRMYYLMKVSYGGMRKHFRTMTNCKPALIPDEMNKLVDMAHERLRRVIIENRDYKDVIKLYDRPWAFFFFDPPYHVEGAKSYVKHFTEENFIEFEEILRNMKGKFLLTINDDDFIRDLFSKSYRIEETRTRYSVTQETKKHFKELYIMNY